jgi:predicted RNA binding protein YcfA (HicA-like mRNA interferase family)
MGRLSGFKYREVVRRLRTFGYTFDRPGPGSHEVWEGTLRAILREADINVEDFLKA